MRVACLHALYHGHSCASWAATRRRVTPCVYFPSSGLRHWTFSARCTSCACVGISPPAFAWWSLAQLRACSANRRTRLCDVSCAHGGQLPFTRSYVCIAPTLSASPRLCRGDPPSSGTPSSEFFDPRGDATGSPRRHRRLLPAGDPARLPRRFGSAALPLRSGQGPYLLPLPPPRPPPPPLLRPLFLSLNGSGRVLLRHPQCLSHRDRRGNPHGLPAGGARDAPRQEPGRRVCRRAVSGAWQRLLGAV